MRIGHADLGVRPPADLPRHHVGADPGQVGLVREQQQVAHQPGVLAVGGGNAGRLIDLGQLSAALLLGLLNPALDVADGFQILVHADLVAGAESALQRADLVGHRVENAAVLADAVEPRRRVGRAAVAEQALEDRPRVVLAEQRGGLVPPRDGVGVGAAEPDVARPRHVAAVERELERTELRVPGRLPRDELVDGHAGAQVRLGARGRHSGQETGGGAGVDAGVARHPVQARQHRHLVAVGLDAAEQPGRLESPTVGLGRPVLHRHPVRHVEHAEPADGSGGAVADGRERRNHAVEQRKGQAGADAPQHGAARNSFPGDDHESDLRIWNAVLFTIPRTIDDQR